MVQKGGDVALDESGAYTGQATLKPVEYQGKPVDFSVEALETMFPDQDQPKAEYQTKQDGSRVMVQGSKSTPVLDENGGALKVRSDQTNPASIQEADQLFNRMKSLPENKGKDENALWIQAWSQSNEKTGDSPDTLKAKFYQDTLKKLLPEGTGSSSGDKANKARQIAEQLTNHFAQTYLNDNQPALSQQPPPTNDTPPMEGAKKSPKDGNWYVMKDGKWNLVEQ